MIKTGSLRTINFIGLLLIFTSIFISFYYLKKEMNYDSFFSKAEQIARFSPAFDGKQADGRIYGKTYDALLKQVPEIEDFLIFSNVNAITLNYRDAKYVVNNLYVCSSNFFEFFDLPFVEGNPRTAFDAPGKIVITEKLARAIFGREDVIGEKIQLAGRRYNLQEGFISGIIKDLPENTHLQTDMLVSDGDNAAGIYPYCYLMLKEGTDCSIFARKLTETIKKEFDDPMFNTVVAEVMPVKDIHLHSHVQRELSPNGNIDYIYLVTGANIMLFIIVLFNLWLNSQIIFSYNRRYYQLLRLNGASEMDLVKDEVYAAFLPGVVSLVSARFVSYFFIEYMGLSAFSPSIKEMLFISILLLASTIIVAILPAMKNLSGTLFDKTNGEDIKLKRFSFSDVKYMLVIQYAIVIFIIIIAAGINRQISLIATTQAGAADNSIIVLNEQPHEVIEKYPVLKQELLTRKGIESVTGGMQLPGSAIRDRIRLEVENNTEKIECPIMVIGEDFFSTFNIRVIEGALPPPPALTYNEELKLVNNKPDKGESSVNIKENVVINKKALSLLGFSSAEEAIGKEIIYHGLLDYIPSGIICGVVEDFVYTNVYEDVIPLVMLQRNLFVNCFMIGLSPDYTTEGLSALNEVWYRLNPDYPLNYSFLKDTYRVLYKNELDAEKIVNLFSVLCLSITVLGLIVFMAFVVRIRTREIGIRKVNGASYFEIIYMLNRSLLPWVFAAYIIAVPAAWFVLNKWLENFAYKTVLGLGVFAGTGLFVAVISLSAISLQSWRAAKINPVTALKTE